MNDPTKTTEGNNNIRLVPTYTDHNGFRMPKGFPVDGFISGLQYAVQPNDLFVVTYPKCGTTWMQYIVYLLLNDGEPLKPEERLTDMFPHLEEVGSDFVSQRAVVKNGYRLIKTHLPYDMTPKQAPDPTEISTDKTSSSNNNNNSNTTAKYIYVARNPKDCVVSFYHHTRGFIKHYDFANGDFDTYFALFLQGQVDFGDYFHNVRSWLNHRRDSNVFVVTYEHLRSNTREVIMDLAQFLNMNLVKQLQANNGALIDKIVHYSSLDQMKEHPQRWSSERPKDHTPFIRNGRVGDWNTMLTPQQANMLDERLQEICTEDELKFLGDAYYT